MIDKDTIVIRNVYYMLAYAYQALSQSNFKKLASEDFDNTEDLFAAILTTGVSQILKQGLRKKYVSHSSDLNVLRGKLLLSGTIKHHLRHNNQIISCEYDELSENNIYNIVIKSTMLLLLKNAKLRKDNRANLRVLLRNLDAIDSVDLRTIPWSTLDRRSKSPLYDMLINICYFVYSNLLISQTAGKLKVLEFTDDAMNKVFEKFVLKHYRLHGLKARAREINWVIDPDHDNDINGLSLMKTDITLTHGDRTLIIDTKYYGKITTTNFDREKVRVGHLYQIFAYVKNLDFANTGKVSGLLLYAKTSDEDISTLDFYSGGNRFAVRTLNLDQDFSGISAALDQIAEEYLLQEA